MSSPDDLWAAARAAESDDPAAAPARYLEAAEAGHPAACNKVGQLRLAAGDLTEAARWFERAGQLGSAEAWFSLGRLCGKGQGVPQDTARAHDCMRKAAALGDERARGFVRDALGEDPDSTPPPPPPRLDVPRSPKASRRGLLISSLLLLCLIAAAAVGVLAMLAPGSSPESPPAPASSALPEAEIEAPAAAPNPVAPDAAPPDAAPVAAPPDAAPARTQASARFAGDGYPPSPRRADVLLTRVLGVRASASSHAEGIDSANVHYDAAQALDGEPDTWWQEGAADNGVGEHLELRWDKPAPVATVRLVPGYLKRRSDRYGDRYVLNNRLARIRLDFGQDRVHTVTLDDRRGWHDVSVEPPVVTDRVRITIDAVYAGRDTRTGEPVTDSGISEVQVWTAP